MENEMLSLLQDIFEEVEPMLGMGKVADYIPALATVNPRQFGISICDIEGRITSIGDASVPFSIQSISKVFNLVLAMNHYGDTMWERVGCEPSGLPFNSLVQLEYENGIPRNPFINAGALVVSDMVQSRFASPFIAMRDFVRRLSCNGDIVVNKIVAESEFEHRSRNAAMAYLMKAYGNFENEVEDVLRNYFHNCAPLKAPFQNFGTVESAAACEAKCKADGSEISKGSIRFLIGYT